MKADLVSSDLLRLPLRLHGIQLGRPVELLLDRDDLRVLGLDILCGDDVHRFLPLPTALVADREITIHSPLVLLEEDELAFYQARTFALSSLRGAPVERSGTPVGTLKEIVTAPDGVLVAVVVESPRGEERVATDETIRVRPDNRSAA